MANKTKILFLLLAFTIIIKSCLAQISQKGTPLSFTNKHIDSYYATIDLAKPNLYKIRKQDSLNSAKDKPYRVSVLIPVNINTENSGTWTKLPEGGKIWRLKIKCNGALALGLYYNNFFMPKGSKLFLYNDAKTQVIGAFTEENNNENNLFATELIQGDALCLEYYEPENTISKPKIFISDISYAYRSVDFLFDKNKNYWGSSGPCEVNINCSEGDNWQDEKKGIVRIYIRIKNETFWCTGSLINNARHDFTPYILTADHCKESYSSGNIANANDLNQWIFYFNYESEGCEDPLTPPVPQTMVGAQKISSGGNSGYSGSDFYLLKLNNSIPASYNIFFNGWNRDGIQCNSGVCIHHPEGDIKKISTFNNTITSSQWNNNGVESHWEVYWAETENGHGVTEGGSSGAPLFDNNGRIIGTLTGGYASCDSSSLNLPDYFGKFSYSWESNDNKNSDTSRLRDWLDPDNTGILYLNGKYLGIENFYTDKINIFPNPAFNEIIIENENISFLKNSKISLYNYLGQKVLNFENSLQTQKIKINLKNQSSGFYIIYIKNDNKIFYKKICIIK